MKKLEKKDIIICVLVVLLVILIIGSTVMIISSKNKDNKTLDSKCETKDSIVVSCFKKLDEKGNNTYILTADKKGELLNYKIRFSYIYDEAQYLSIKNGYKETKEQSMEFNDEKHEVTTINTYDSILDSNGEQAHMWYKDYMKSLTTTGYECEEEE